MKILTTLIVLGAVAAQQAPTRELVRVTVNGEDVTFATTQPYVKGGHTLVPIRGVFEKIGAKVDYDATKKMVSAYKPGTEVVLIIGSNKALVNNEEKWIPMPAQVTSGSTMVPLRFLTETLGGTISYDYEAKIVNIYVPQHEDDLRPGDPPPVTTTGTEGRVH
ncbi:MAG: copper amine oxidase N-terminal domain-containing protein [Fimbriimonadaceae bacterium]|nr:MAG: copper amine oxidase N-terminal domain-containing protein [Fimbriimonadaceae bacterium]